MASGNPWNVSQQRLKAPRRSSLHKVGPQEDGKHLQPPRLEQEWKKTPVTSSGRSSVYQS